MDAALVMVCGLLPLKYNVLVFAIKFPAALKSQLMFITTGL